MNESPTVPVLLTKEQASTILQLMDLAVKAQGLAVAGAALAVQQHLEEAFKAHENTPAGPA